ncbi:hypothetical protein GON01_08385 [Sphingomonas sp. MAH-20]|uniref:Uncharacterized protein n=1 Tax=Sphingomonas horti TaxID=2682842 RepID=A0A6I4J080_9SPHN|nr:MULTISPECIES: hypothetical protein [Sphingomonas]MBA2920069.1 hypothetical protein [Sphingomonas sp. CGMCC 1.13658]MVO77949.1 hypothetical protein [Sphingomonas horti]
MTEPKPLGYLPADHARPAKLNEVTSPAILLPINGYGEPFAVVGTGASTMACFLGDRHQFEAMAQSKGEHFSGLAIENVRFEVDVASAYSLEGVFAVPGSLVRTGDKLELVVRTDQGHYPRTTRAPVAERLTPTSDDVKVGFRRWRAVLQVQDDTILIWEAEALSSPER